MSKTKKFNAMMFDQLKDSLKKTDNQSAGTFSNIMKFPAGHEYRIRLIPNVENIDETFFHHKVHSWKSNATGKFTSAISLQTFGESDPIANLRWKLFSEWKKANPNPGVDNSGNPIRFKSPIDQKEQWFVNALWVENPDNPELNGTVQILKVGPQLKEKIDAAMTGNRAEEFGAAIFDLSKGGCDFVIVAAEQGQFTTFKDSYFTTKSKLNLSDDEIEEVYTKVHDLKAVYPVKTEEELNTLLEDHFFCGEGKIETKKEVKAKPKAKAQKVEEDEEEDNIPMDFGNSDDVDDEVDELLEDLED